MQNLGLFRYLQPSFFSGLLDDPILFINVRPTGRGILIDCGLFQPAEIGNEVFEDTNRNGVRDAGEPGVAGATISISGPDGYADIVIVMIDNIAAVDARIDRRIFLEGFDAGLDEELHQAELDTVLLGEMLLVTPAQPLYPRHVRFVERRQHGGLLTGLQQACGDSLTNRRHDLAGHRAAVICGLGRDRGGLLLFLGSLFFYGCSRGLGGLGVGEDIV